MRLTENIGYVDVRELCDLRRADAAVSLVMQQLGESPALILDFRSTLNGNPAIAAVLSSYLFDTEPVHLDAVYLESGVRPERPAPRVATARYVDRDVYVLIGPHTAPAAAELARRLQRMGRALVVGQAPRGYADFPAVTPDLACGWALALQLAHATACKRLLAIGAASNERQTQQYVAAVDQRIGRDPLALVS
jgi:C-terminal processing protease CtpA/Prc